MNTSQLSTMQSQINALSACVNAGAIRNLQIIDINTSEKTFSLEFYLYPTGGRDNGGTMRNIYHMNQRGTIVHTTVIKMD